MDTDHPGYDVVTTGYHIGSTAYLIRTLLNRQQFSDPDGLAERAGISSATWPLFGVVWPVGLALAEAMSRFPIQGKRILEVGCGIGLPSLVLQQRGADITASDYHPLAEEFLRHNTDLNGLPPIHFVHAPWLTDPPGLGRFDVIIGSDLLYEREHPALLATFLASHANPTCQILVADPGRHYCGQFTTKMIAQGYVRTESKIPLMTGLPSVPQGRLLNFIRTEASA